MSSRGEGSVKRVRLLAYLEDYLGAREGRDACPNGLQVEGRTTIRKIVCGVSACRDLFERAADLSADAVLVHHGILWEGAPRELTGVQYQRVKRLIESGLNLLAYHLPLDRHPEVGNNALAARSLGLDHLEPFGRLDGLPLGFKGQFATPLPVDRFVERCRQVFGQEPLIYRHGPDPLASAAIVSGAAQRSFQDAIEEGLDLFLTGEVSEWVLHTAQESETHYVAAGHYATERLGIRALGEHLRDRFGLEVTFVDLPNPV